MAKTEDEMRAEVKDMLLEMKDSIDDSVFLLNRLAEMDGLK